MLTEESTEGSVLVSPHSHENQRGVRPSSQESQIHQIKYKLVLVLLLAATPQLPALLFLKISLPELTLLMSQTYLEPNFQTQGAEDLASQHVV